ncbi:hypothetical protein, partial [Terribacillus halophilus]|uniref:hypothetical protein n=1 Tax=Terribacillus halophilus TaxID=361279 RepID=UPI003561E88A
MRKLMYLFASIAIVAILATGCSSADSESKSDSGADKTEKTETTDTKKELLQTQMDFTADFSTYYAPIAAYQAAAADEATTEDELNTAAESAKKAADEGAAKLTDYKLESNLSDEQKEAYTKSLDP